jgi:hypothetical protein
MKRPVQIVEISQPRCALRFGTAPCPATGTPKCYNTWATCPTSATRAVFDNTGRIRWRFIRNSPGAHDFGDFADPDDVATPCIPVNGLTVSTSKSQVNVAGILQGKSPFGVRATVSISMEDFVWDDVWGDFYRASRGTLPKRFFWATFLARNKLFSKMEISVYDGYEGDALAAMRKRLYIVDEIDGPSNGKVTVKGIDPLMLADGRRSLFPPSYGMSLYADITDTATSLDVITDAEANVSSTIGITTGRHILLGSEIIGYSGYTVVTPGQYTLTGLTRAMGGTTAKAGRAGDKIGRVGHFANTLLADAAEYLLGTQTPVGSSRIDSTGWHDERDGFLATSYCNTFIPSPTPVVDLMGELCQQGTFFVWWDEFSQLVKLQAIRPPTDTVAVLTDDAGVLADTASKAMEPDARLTRIFVYYSPIDATKSGPENYRVITGQIEGEAELPEAGGDARTLQIFARWVTTEAQAYQIISRIFLRYKNIPETMSLQISAKDRTIGVGDVIDITSRVVVAGQRYQLDLQDFALTGRFARFMDVSASSTFAAASDAEKAAGCYLADTTGLMPDGSAGYQFG